MELPVMTHRQVQSGDPFRTSPLSPACAARPGATPGHPHHPSITSCEIRPHPAASPDGLATGDCGDPPAESQIGAFRALRRGTRIRR